MFISCVCFSSANWIYYNEFPWVWDNHEKAWLYLRGTASGKIFAYHHQDKTWREFNAPDDTESSLSSVNEESSSSMLSEISTILNALDLPSRWSVSSALNLEMIWVGPGSFTMGSPFSDPERLSHETQHQVTLTKGFYLAKFEVTQAQYEAVMKGNTDGLIATPSSSSGKPNQPVENISWNDTQVFLTRLNGMQSTNIPANWSYALPTEAEWEYACRAGTNTAYFWGGSISSTHANYNSNIGSPSDVGEYSPNAWGFYDMHGNVREWVQDYYEEFSTHAAIDPVGPEWSWSRILRGGSYSSYGGSGYSDGAQLRSASRDIDYYSSMRMPDAGFRVALKRKL